MPEHELQAEGLVIVTGAASGIGAAVVRSAATRGARVIALDSAWESDDPSTAVGQAIWRRVHDVSNVGEWSALAEEIAAGVFGRLTRVDSLVNAAGISYRARLGEVELDEWDRVLGVNLTGPMLAMQALVPLMDGGGAVVNIGSLAATNSHYPVAYTSSKWALRGLTHVAAMQYGPLGIRVNIVHPGFIETPMTASAPTAMRDAQLELTPLARTGEPEEVAEVVLFLLGAGAAYVTGAEIPVDGGAASTAGAKVIADRLGSAADR